MAKLPVAKIKKRFDAALVSFSTCYNISERIREKVATQNAEGLPSRPAFPSSPGAVLTVGG